MPELAEALTEGEVSVEELEQSGRAKARMLFACASLAV